jgi:hypothetical protein
MEFEMIDIDKLAKEIGFTFDLNGNWVFEDEELQLFVERVMQAERERSKELVGVLQDALRYVPTGYENPRVIHERAKAAIDNATQ